VRAPEGVRSAVLNINGVAVEVFFVAFAYPTDLAAAQAWERCDRSAKRKSHHFSVYRLQDPKVAGLVIALSETEAPIRSARRLLSGATPHEISSEHLRAFYLRRARVTMAQGPIPGDAFQRARYGRTGALLSQDGQLHPRRRPQG
jgi:hypothetical protein